MGINWEHVYRHMEKIFPFHAFDSGTMCSLGEEVPVADFIALLRLLGENNPKTILEIGSWTGSCTCLFGNYVKEYGGKVHSIDNFKGSPGSNQYKYTKIARRRFFENIRSHGLEDTVVFHEGDSDRFRNLDMKFDMVFIDADHRYSQIRKDIDNYLPKVNPGGIICGHDFQSPKFDEKYIEQDFVNGVHHGVTKAVVESFNKVLLFTALEEGKQRLISSVWHFKTKREPCMVAL